MKPGETALTRMPRGASSFEAERVAHSGDDVPHAQIDHRYLDGVARAAASYQCRLGSEFGESFDRPSGAAHGVTL